MINLQVDEGYAFDYLAILYIKRLRKINDRAYDAWKECYYSLRAQIHDEDLWGKIINSVEMDNLIRANETTFEAVEKARYADISAKEVDEANMLRYNAKVALQEKFFKTKPTEYKT